MKNYVIASLAFVFMVSCSNEELQNHNDSQLTPLDNLVKELPGTSENKSSGGTKNDPIIVPEGEAFPAFEFGKYYQVYGELVTLTSVPGVGGNLPNFLYREVPNSDKIQRIQFKNDQTGISYIGEEIDYPFAIFDCNALEANNGVLNGEKYMITKENDAVYQDFVINFYTSTYRFSGRCGSENKPAPPILCADVPRWKSGESYAVGDKVVYAYRLFLLLPEGWQELGRCEQF